jgi:hypothetical protein
MAGLKHPVTPDGRYFVVEGKLWRMSNPALGPRLRSVLVHELMDARRAVKNAKSDGDHQAEALAHRAVDKAKTALGERGPVWWTDGEPDFNRQPVKNSPYAAWYARGVRGKDGPHPCDARSVIFDALLSRCGFRSWRNGNPDDRISDNICRPAPSHQPPFHSGTKIPIAHYRPNRRPGWQLTSRLAIMLVKGR